MGEKLVHKSSIEVYELQYENKTYEIHQISDPKDGCYQETKVYFGGIVVRKSLAIEIIDAMEALL